MNPSDFPTDATLRSPENSKLSKNSVLRSEAPNESLVGKYIQSLKKWVILDKQLQYVNTKTRQIRESKSRLTKELCEFVRANPSLGNKTVELDDGELRFVEKREYTPLSFSYIKDCLDKVIASPADVDRIVQYIKDNREVRVSRDIRRFEYESDEDEDEA